MSESPAIRAAREIGEYLDGWRIVTGDEPLDSITKPILVVWTADVTQTNQTIAEASVEIWALAPETKATDAEAAIWKIVTQALAAIHAAMPGLGWLTATRGVLGGRFPGYNIPITLATTWKD